MVHLIAPLLNIFITINVFVIQCYCQQCDSVVGTFPNKYLEIDKSPSPEDLDLYLKKIKLTLGFLENRLNSSSVNVAISLFLSKTILYKVLEDYGETMQKDTYKQIKSFLASMEVAWSYYHYRNKEYGILWLEDEELDEVIKEDNSIVMDSVGEYSKNQLTKWILNESTINLFTRQMDDISLPKEDYINLFESMNSLQMTVAESDFCLSRIVHTPPAPRAGLNMRACRADFFCDPRLTGAARVPTAAYALSHRQLNLLLRHMTRRCYVTSSGGDARLLQRLCAAMYREAVYIARRGFFARDMFLEHIALCSMLGYEEFHRTSWYKKISTWFNHQGCASHTLNHEVNMSRVHLDKLVDGSKVQIKAMKRNSKYLKKQKKRNCDVHPTILALVVMCQGVRYALHTLK